MLKPALAFAIGAVLSAQNPPAPQVGPDLAGRWNRESVSGDTDGGSAWGSRVDIGRSGTNVTVRPESGKPEEYRTDGTETADVLSVKGCANQSRVTKYQPSTDRVTITTWLVTKSGCFHGEFEDEPLVYRTGPIAMSEVRGTRRLESITVIFRDGDVLRVDTTRTAPKPGGPVTSSTTTYRK